MKYNIKAILFLTIGFLFISQSYGQVKLPPVRIGLESGVGTQQFFPYNNSDYSHNVTGYKGLFNYSFKKSGKLSYELQLEPGIYKARHRLLNKYFVQPAFGANYLELREKFSQEKTISEYAFNIGILVRYNLKDQLSFFVLGSVGPMISDTDTERLARGFAFSDIFALGVSYKVGRIMFELRPGLRHVSNLNLKYPNSGHNSSNIDFGISVAL